MIARFHVILVTCSFFKPQDFMANLLAIALGAPPDSTHLYNRIFLLASLNGTCGPGAGSTFFFVLLRKKRKKR